LSSEKVLLAVVSLAGLAVAFGFTGFYGSVMPRRLSPACLSAINLRCFSNYCSGDGGSGRISLYRLCSKFKEFQGEYYALVLLSTIGMMLIAAAADLITIFVALELISISFYALVGFLKDPKSSEASLKYLLLGAIASAILLYGMALSSVLPARRIGRYLAGDSTPGFDRRVRSTRTDAGTCPDDCWFWFQDSRFPIPDVGAGCLRRRGPTPITAFLSVASKAAGFAVILRIFYSSFISPSWLSQDWGDDFRRFGPPSA